MKFAPESKRVAIFVYYDADGMVDDYVPLLVGAVRAHCTHLLCMVNGALTDSGKARLAAVSDEVLLRPNEGLDITAYKEGYWHLRDTGLLADADELLFFNQTVFGPVYPFAETFDAMNDRDLDFWGMTRHRGLNTDLSNTAWSIIPYGYMPPHIQSYFFAVRRSMFDTDAFRRYWDELPIFKSYVEAVALHEVCFTKKFADQGFVWDVYAHTEPLEAFREYPLMGMPVPAIRATRCPVVKRKSFLCGTTDISTLPHGGAVAQLYRFLKNETAYDTGLIVQNVTRTAPIKEYTHALALVLQETTDSGAADVTVVIDAANSLFAAAAAKQLAGMAARVLLLTREKTEITGYSDQIAVIKTAQTGLAALAEVLPHITTEFLLYLDSTPTITQDDIAEMEVFSNGLACLKPLSSLAGSLITDENIGMVLPLPDSHLERLSGDILWPQQYKKAAAVLKSAKISVPLSFKNAPVRTDGGFFARTAILAPLMQMDLTGLQQDALPIRTEEYLPSLLCQAAGKLCAFSADAAAAGERVIAMQAQLTALSSFLATPNKMRIDQLVFRGQGIVDFYNERRRSMTLEQAFAAPLSFKEKLWIVLRILLSAKAFDRLYRLSHGGHAMPAPQYPPDPLD